MGSSPGPPDLARLALEHAGTGGEERFSLVARARGRRGIEVGGDAVVAVLPLAAQRGEDARPLAVEAAGRDEAQANLVGEPRDVTRTPSRRSSALAAWKTP